MSTKGRRKDHSRTGAAAVELAILLPFLAFLGMGAFDFCRVFYYATIVDSCARAGAVYGSADQTNALDDAGINTAAVQDDSGIGITKSQVMIARDSNTAPTTLTVSVSYTFNTITPLRWGANSISLKRSCVISVPVALPNNP